MTKDIKLIITDLDNTIMPTGHDRISPYLKVTLKKAVDQGYHFMLDTGRHYTFLHPSLFEDLPLEFIGTINGACLTDRNGMVLEKHPMRKDIMEKLIAFCSQNKIGLGFKFEDAVVTYAHHEIFLDGYVGNHHELRQLVIDDTKLQTHHLQYGLPLGTFIIGDEDVVKPMITSIPELTFAWSAKRGFDVFMKEINKTTCVETVLKHYGYTWENVIAFGDAGNDTPLLKKAGIGVAMANGKDDVKQYADVVTDTCINDGVAKIIEECLL